MNLRRVDLKTLSAVPDEHPFVAGVMELPPDIWPDLTNHGYSGVGYWPEVVDAPTFDADTHKLGDEILTVDAEVKKVSLTYAVVPLTAEEIDERRKAKIPLQVTMRQATQALILAGLDDDVETMLGQMPGVEGKLARAEWGKSQVVERNRPLVLQLGAALGLDEAAIDQLFITAATL